MKEQLIKLISDIDNAELLEFLYYYITYLLKE